MKKNMIILAVAVTQLAFFSCRKEKVEIQPSSTSVDEIAFKPIIKPVINLDSGLVARYEFDGNLKEQTGQLAGAVPTLSSAVTYTVDRKGNSDYAIEFTGRYGLDISKIPLTSTMSVSAWVKYDNAFQSTNYFLSNFWLSPEFAQDNNSYWGIITTPQTSGVPSGAINDQWHHLVATYDGTRLNFYVDGSYVGMVINPNQGLPIPQGATVDYEVGYLTPFMSKIITSTWFGSMDDLRFYTRILSGAEVKALYML